MSAQPINIKPSALVWVEALRIRTLPLASTSAILSAGIAAHADAFKLPVFILSLITAILLQVMANFADEYGDLEKGVDDEGRIGPIRGMQRGEISKELMKRVLIGMSVLTFIVGISLLFIALDTQAIWALLLFVVLGVASIWASIAYTVGKHAYGYMALGDIMSFFFFGIVGVMGGTYLYTTSIDLITALIAVAFGLPVIAVINTNNMRDAQNDRAKGKITVANSLGNIGMRAYQSILLIGSLALFVVAFVLAGVMTWYSYLFLIPGLAYLMVVIKTWKITDDADFDQLMKPLGIFTFVIGVLVNLGLVFA